MVTRLRIGQWIALATLVTIAAVCQAAAPTATPAATATAAPTATKTATPTAAPTTAPTAAPTTAPTATPVAAKTATPAPLPGSATGAKSDIDRIFPPDTWTPGGQGRELMIARCNNCHSYAPVVVGTCNADNTDYLKKLITVEHVSGVPTTWGVVGTTEELTLVYTYLANALFGKPVPDLPAEWIAKWSYY
jgi:hypothetical protein